MTGLIIALCVLMAVAMFCMWVAKKTESLAPAIFAILLFIICGGIISDISTYYRPTAIDVYRGNTTLQITYQDSIPIDTIVVFKIK